MTAELFTPSASTLTPYRVTINYNRSLAEMIKSGDYADPNENITSENFPHAAAHTIDTEIVLVHFNRLISSEDALEEMHQLGLFPAALLELLAIGETYPTVQEAFPIVALGTTWSHGDCRYVPALSQWSAKRKLSLFNFFGDWPSRCRFCAVGK